MVDGIGMAPVSWLRGSVWSLLRSRRQGLEALLPCSSYTLQELSSGSRPPTCGPPQCWGLTPLPPGGGHLANANKVAFEGAV